MQKRHPGFATTVTRELAEATLPDVETLIDRLLSAIFTDNPEWTDYGSVPRDDLREGCRDYLTRVLELLSGRVAGPDPADEVVGAIARHRAEQGVPLEVMLRTFRLGGRIVWEALLERAEQTGVAPDDVLDAGTATWTVIDELSSALSTSYRDSEQERVRHDEQRRNALIEDLLGRRAGDTGFAARVARELELPATGGYLVVVADVRPDGTPALAGPRTVLDALGFRSVWQTKVDTRIGVVALEQRDAADVVACLRPLARGRSAASPAVSGLAEAATAYTLAMIALSMAPSTATELVCLDEHYPEALLVRSPDLAQRLVARNLGGILDRPAREREVLLETLIVWLEEDRSTANAAVRLHCHRNTVLNRLHRITELVGRPLHGRAAYVELSLALSVLDLPQIGQSAQSG
ncbi:helix-turn-helix domain-containing protein [Mycolicibacterium wolinskyi]|uniref:PucR family transcriptional regulator n=1 Tax=Mycolicibacterium wolinskyi TaxID=59750 RepID=A0A1X2FFB8_9MYCO|nr:MULTISPECIES: helix-turn-helix domain-containing protein [Mycolicibacterium]MCV7284617.1 helix-turn-helix domain-containing protein [Mycolicibacterium wolinskyi]MCV7292002.1 helix-turn-helix domain-containing protein [Mycolicibacterium goodii]ORX16689.1 PucR family transcriptional regulator [Mycolicibacterium wolinskyi]